MTRMLGIDLGGRRIGLAVAELGRDPAHPVATIKRGGSDAEDTARLESVVREQAIDLLVVGLPLNANGDEGPMAEAARAWAAMLSEALGIPARLRDERLSSHRAEARLGPMPHGRSGGAPSPTQRERYRARVDREAAAIILEDEIQAMDADALAGESIGAGR